MAVQFNTTQSQYFPASSTSSSPHPLEAVKNEHNRATIEKIKKFIAEGFKVNVFIGRGPAEPLPAPDHLNEIWVSIDPSLKSNEELPADRLHLILSCNDSAEMASIQHLFFKVVVDQSTMKFFQPGIIDRLTSLLNRVDVDNSLLFESLINGVSPDPSIPDWNFDHHQNSIGINEEKINRELTEYYEASKTCLDNFIQEIGGKENLASNPLYKEFLSTLPDMLVQELTTEELLSFFSPWLATKKGILYPPEKYISLARQKTLDYLDKRYDNVELKANTPYPYWTNYRGDYDHFFVGAGTLEGIKIRNNAAVIRKIVQFVAEGKKVSLFIGRGPNESLPNDPNKVWVSLDPSLRKSKELSSDRLHLILSCNDSGEMASIQHLFSEVVVDQSTWKFFDPGIIDRLTPLLTQDAESTLIFESTFQFTACNNEIDTWKFDHIKLNIPTKERIQYVKEQKDCLDNFLQEIGGKENLAAHPLYQEFLDSMDLTKFRRRPTPDQLLGEFQGWLSVRKGIPTLLEKYVPLARQKTIDYLKTVLNYVELKLDTPYPYWTTGRTGHDHFFVAKGPKSS
jgi:hypothetical protein